MTDTFNWRATAESTGGAALRVRRTQFGDGYAQSVRDGLNAVGQTWNLVFVFAAATIGEIEAFLDAHAGVSFQWKAPRRPLAFFQCDEYQTDDLGGGVWRLRATFTQRYQP
ncbi:hypothetical protein A7A76_07835 [Lysobacter enzymogenes]|uniref:phage tail protein n=1 Tax=Lysobacter enzymogenes TaxID=69 RepID=UPI0019D0574E|nr:phage tail protein [Lysobacter enzymogenes]MBN7139004.1 hypothetical protein [Lysobacter enzymogenes]